MVGTAKVCRSETIRLTFTVNRNYIKLFFIYLIEEMLEIAEHIFGEW